MEDYKVYMQKFKIALGIVGGALLLAIFLISKTVPEFQKISNLQQEYKTQSEALVEAERRLQGLKTSAAEKKVEENNIIKAFFKPVSGGNDTETAIADEFGEILQLIRANKIKARSIKYDYDPQDDNFVKNAAGKYHVCRVTADMIANYSDFEKFLRELYKHEHFLDISKIEIVPYEKNKRILLINVQIKLYAQKGAAADVETPRAPKNTGNTNNNVTNTTNNANNNTTNNNDTVKNVPKPKAPPNLGESAIDVEALKNGH